MINESVLLFGADVYSNLSRRLNESDEGNTILKDELKDMAKKDED